MNTALLKNLWQRLLLLALLCVVGHGTCSANADDEFKNEKNFTAKAVNDHIHFKLLTAADDGINRWAVGKDSSPKVLVSYQRAPGIMESPEIIVYRGYDGTSEYNLWVQQGIVVVTNDAHTENKVLNSSSNYYAYSSTKNNPKDLHYLEFDWYPPSSLLEKTNTFNIEMHIPFDNSNPLWPRDSRTYKVDNLKLSETPKVEARLDKMCTDKEKAQKGKLFSVNYTTDGDFAPMSYTSSLTGNNKFDISGGVQPFFYEAADTVTDNVSYTFTFSRNNESLFVVEGYNTLTVKSNTISLPAYHRIHNFGIDNSGLTSRLTWEMNEIGQTDYQPEDAFVIQCSTSPDFKDIEATVPLTYNLGNPSSNEEYEFTSEITNNKQKFYCKLFGENEGAIYYYRIQRQSTTNLGWEHSLVVSASTNKFISDLCVSVFSNSTEARNSLLNRGYKLLDYNLNHGVKGSYVYIGYKESYNPVNAISRIAIKRGSRWSADKNTTYTDIDNKVCYNMKAVPNIGIKGANLNDGIAGADSLYLYYSRDNIKGKGNSVISRILHTSSVSGSSLPSGIRVVGENIADTETAINLNSGCPEGTEVINLVCVMHEHISDFYGKKYGNDISWGHDCCGMYYSKALNGGVLEISNADELYQFAELVNTVKDMTDIKAKLTADIVLNENVTIMDNNDILTSQLNPDTTTVEAFRNWKPIGDFNHKFCGEFDGNGYTISGLYCKKDGEAGLFGFLGNSAVISNVTLKDSYIESTKGDCGGICGNINLENPLEVTTNIIKSCTFEGVIKVTSTYNAGGIFGQSYSSFDKQSVINIENCATRGVIYHDGAVNSYSAGIIGILKFGTANVKNCYSYIENTSGKEGLIGNSSGCRLKVDNSYYLVNNKTASNSQGKIEENREAQSKEDFKSGKVAFLLNENQDKPQWSQIIYTDLYPVFFDGDKHTADAATVYKVEGYTCTDKNISADTFLYSNRSDEPAMLVHNGKRHHVAKQATCVERGCLEYWECFDCSTFFSNAECTTIIINEPYLEATAQHDYDVYTETCVNCGKSRHQIEEEAVAIEAVETDGIKSQMFDLHGRQVTESHRGITLIKGADGKVHKILKK